MLTLKLRSVGVLINHNADWPVVALTVAHSVLMPVAQISVAAKQVEALPTGTANAKRGVSNLRSMDNFHILVKYDLFLSSFYWPPLWT